MARELPKPGEFYRHFKNKNYEIVTVAAHSETGEKYVVYRALYGAYQDYVRPMEMFMSEVDREKYPDAAQQYRFEKVGDRILGLALDAAGESAEPVSAVAQETFTNAGAERPVSQEEMAQAEEPADDYIDWHIYIEETRAKRERAAEARPQMPEPEEEAEPSPERNQELLLAFLNAETYDDKLEVLRVNQKLVNDKLIDDIGVVMDLPIKEGDLELRYHELVTCLRTMSRYDGRRLREK